MHFNIYDYFLTINSPFDYPLIAISCWSFKNFSLLADDRSENTFSYYEFLQHLKTQVKWKWGILRQRMCALKSDKSLNQISVLHLHHCWIPNQNHVPAISCWNHLTQCNHPPRQCLRLKFKIFLPVLKAVSVTLTPLIDADTCEKIMSDNWS